MKHSSWFTLLLITMFSSQHASADPIVNRLEVGTKMVVDGKDHGNLSIFRVSYQVGFPSAKDSCSLEKIDIYTKPCDLDSSYMYAAISIASIHRSTQANDLTCSVKKLPNSKAEIVTMNSTGSDHTSVNITTDGAVNVAQFSATSTEEFGKEVLNYRYIPFSSPDGFMRYPLKCDRIGFQTQRK